MLTSTFCESRKLFAAAVMVTYLATAISAIAVNEAGRRTVETAGSGCQFKDLDQRMLRLELGEEVPFKDQCHAFCILGGLDRMLDADTWFLFSYSALNFSFFLFLAAIGRIRYLFVWLSAGLHLAFLMLSADLSENGYIRQWIGQYGTVAPSPFLFNATAVKWGTLAVAGVLVGLIYLFHPRRVARLVALPAFAAAALLWTGLEKKWFSWINYGSAALGLLWLGILIHAVIVAIEPPPSDMPQAAGQGESHE